MRKKQQRRQFTPKKRYITNERIRGDEFRLIDDKGEQVGVVSRDEAFAYAKAREIDLILIASQAKPLVVKAIDLHKHIYQEEKKNKDSKKGQKKSGTKDVQLSLFIGEGDLERFRKKSIEFLEDGYQVRIRLLLKGRELGKKPMAFDKVHAFIGSLGEVTVAVPPKMQGRVCTAVVVRKK